MNFNKKITINNLIFSLLFFVFGIILFTSTEDLISIASKIIGIILIIVGIIKTIVYIYMKGKMGKYKTTELIIGILIICCGVLLLLYSNVLSFAIRIIIGTWVFFVSINKIIFALSIRRINSNGFKVYITTSLLMLIVGMFLLSGFFDRIVGIFIIVYSIIEIIDYIYFKVNNKEYESVNKEKSKKIKNKRLKESKVVDAIIEEEK